MAAVASSLPHEQLAVGHDVAVAAADSPVAEPAVVEEPAAAAVAVPVVEHAAAAATALAAELERGAGLQQPLAYLARLVSGFGLLVGPEV